MENGVESKTTATQKRRLRKKKNRAEQRQRRDDQTNKEATGNEEEEETASKNGLPVRRDENECHSVTGYVQDGVEVKYVSAPRDFTTFFIDDGVGETPNGAGPSTKHKSDSDTEMEEKPRGRRRRRPRSRSSSEEPIDGLAAVNQVGADIRPRVQRSGCVCSGRVGEGVQSHLQPLCDSRRADAIERNDERKRDNESAIRKSARIGLTGGWSAGGERNEERCTDQQRVAG